MILRAKHIFKCSVSILAILAIIGGMFCIGAGYRVNAEQTVVKSDLFNYALDGMFKLDGKSTFAEVNTNSGNKPEGAVQSIRFGQSLSSSQYPGIHLWDTSVGGSGKSFGDLFGSVDTKKYTGIRVWIKKGSDTYSKLRIFIDRLDTGVAPPTSGDKRYVYTIMNQQLTSTGSYIEIPFSSFYLNNNSANPSFDPAVRGNPNYIAFQTGDGGAARPVEYFIADLQLYGDNVPGGTEETGDTGDTEDGFEYVTSSLFNTSTQAQWDKAYMEGKTSGGTTYATVSLDTTNKPLSASQSVKIGQTTGAKGYVGAIFWDNSSDSARKTYGDLFGSADVSKYTGIKIWLKRDVMPYPAIRIRIGRMGSGSWWPQNGEFYTYSIATSSIPDEGKYFYIPFSDFKTPSGVVYDPTAGKPNFIGFQTGDSTNKICSFYVSDLKLYREEEKEPEEDIPTEYPVPDPNDTSNPANPEYTYIASDVFNFATQSQWNSTKIEGAGTTRTVDKTEDNKHSSAYQSVKIHATGSTGYASVFFWDENNGRRPYGDLFGTTNTSRCTGIRLFLKTTDNCSMKTLKIFIDRIGNTTGYYKTEEKSYIAQLELTSGFKGYVDIPFTSFIRSSDGATFNPSAKPDMIAFKAIGITGADDIWISNLFVYYDKQNDIEPQLPNNPLDTVTYEYITSDRFNNASQDQWNHTKQTGAGTDIFVTNGKDHAPMGMEKSYRFYTAGDTKTPDVYFWNEYVGENGKAARKTYGELFGSAKTDQYLGIAVWVELSPLRAGSEFRVMIGRMSGTTYWPSSKKGFYVSKLTIPKEGYKGYIYIPFESFKDLTGESFSPENKPNFIAFRYEDSAAMESNTYIYDLKLYRKNTGKKIEIPKSYQYLRSTLFNTSTQDMWNETRHEGGAPIVTVNKIKDNIPSGMDRSFIYHTDKNKLTSNYPGVYFWKESEDMESRATFGNLFGKTSLKDYDGITLWLKTGEEHYDNLYIIFGRMSGSTYWPGNGFYTAKVEIPYEGLDGYVYIPFEEMTNQVGLSYNDVRKANFIGFKYSDTEKVTTDLYISDLSLYREVAVGDTVSPKTGNDGFPFMMLTGLLLVLTGACALFLLYKNDIPLLHERI